LDILHEKKGWKTMQDFRIVQLQDVKPQLASDCIGICSNAILQFITRINKALKEEEKLNIENHFFQIVREYYSNLGFSTTDPNQNTYKYHVVWAFPLTFNKKSIPASIMSHAEAKKADLENILWFEFKFFGTNTDEVPSSMEFSANIAGNSASNEEDRIVTLFDGPIAPLSMEAINDKLLSRVFDDRKTLKCIYVLMEHYESNRILKIISE
jgi:hypothetical protein